jgi:hypothetical protein
MRDALKRGGLTQVLENCHPETREAIMAWRGSLEEDLGGIQALGTARQSLVAIATADVLLLAVADAFIADNPTDLILRKERRFIKLIEQRQRIAEHLQKVLEALGLDRKAREVNVADWVHQRTTKETE